MWIAVAIISYLLFAVVAIIDKYLLSGPLPSPKTYAFYVGVLGGGAAVLFALFGFIEVPETPILLLGLLAGMMRVLFLFALFRALSLFEASKIVPALGAMLPLFLLFFVFVFAGDTTIFAPPNLIAFLLLVGGALGVSWVKQSLRITAQSFRAASLAAFLGASSFFFSKFAYDAQPFLSALAWVLLGGFGISFVFLASREVRKEIARMIPRQKKTEPMASKSFPVWIFLANQTFGGGAALLQNLAIALVPLGSLSFVGALGGVQYIFLFAFAVFLSRRFPSVLREEISRRILIQKAAAILLIGAGLAILAL